MGLGNAIGDLLQSRPEFYILTILVGLIPLILIFALIMGRRLTERERIISALLGNSAVQERIKDQNTNLAEFLGQMLKAADQTASSPAPVTLFSKVAQDITWDVSGLIGVLVTVVLMVMIVSRDYSDIPREVFAGWTTILGFYFGKAARK